jgi:glycerol kinase
VTSLAIDAGTTTVRCVVVDDDGRPVGEERLSLPPTNPAPGLVEFDALALAEAVVGLASEVLARHGPVGGVGIASQRASAIAWDRTTGQPFGPGIGWQDLRTSGRCLELRAEGVFVAPNQSATKFEWMMGEGNAVSGGDLCLGTVDSWLAWVLTGATAHVTDLTNAAATGLLATDGSWDTALLDHLSIPVGSLPELVGSAGVVATASVLSGSPVISAMVGDQQASLIGLGCVSAGQTKLTAGTGAMVDMCTGDVAGTGADGCYAMPAWATPGGVAWMLEGAVLSAGSAVAWLVDLGVVPDVASTHDLASGCDDTGGVVFVPALSGLGTPTWDDGARGTLLGVTRGTGRAEICRAVLEGVAHCCADVIEVLAVASGTKPGAVRLDGGMSANPTFVQALADASRMVVERSSEVEATALGAAALARVATGDAADPADAMEGWQPVEIVRPRGPVDRDRWAEAVSRARP